MMHFKETVDSNSIGYTIYCFDFIAYKYLSTGMLWITFPVELEKYVSS